MTKPARKLIDEVLALTESERLEVASEILASVDGPVEAGWDLAWAAEIDRREQAAKGRDQAPSDWSDARTRIAERLARSR